MSILCRICCKRPELLQCRQLSTSTLKRLKSPVRTFQKLLDKRPLLTNSLIGGFFMFAGDLTQQLYFNSVIKWKEVFIFYNIFFGSLACAKDLIVLLQLSLQFRCNIIVEYISSFISTSFSLFIVLCL